MKITPFKIPVLGCQIKAVHIGRPCGYPSTYCSPGDMCNWIENFSGRPRVLCASQLDPRERYFDKESGTTYYSLSALQYMVGLHELSYDARSFIARVIHQASTIAAQIETGAFIPKG